MIYAQKTLPVAGRCGPGGDAVLGEPWSVRNLCNSARTCYAGAVHTRSAPLARRIGIGYAGVHWQRITDLWDPGEICA
jgi:hypothetical protein